jgi:glutaredoxin 2
LREKCEELGLVEPETITKALTDKPMLRQKQYTPEEIQGLQKCFVYYVNMPKNRWKDIERAEKNTPEGKRIFEDLKAEYMEKYMCPPNDTSKEEFPNVADLEYGMENAN